MNIFLEVPGDGGARKRIPIEQALVDPKTGKPMPKVKWLFTGSVMSKPDPDKHEKVYGADLTGTLIAIFPVTDETVFQTSLTHEGREVREAGDEQDGAAAGKRRP